MTDRRPFGARPLRFLLLFGLLLWVLAPPAALWSLWKSGSHVTLESSEPLFVPASEPPAVATQDVSLVLSWEATPGLVAPDWHGLVQKVSVAAGSKVDDGTVICVIDGISRSAWKTPSPFYRSLAMGDRGPDVLALNSGLRSRGYSASAGEIFGPSTLRGVQSYARAIGARGNITQFDPAWVLFLQRDMRVSEVQLTLGTPAPSAGTQLTTGKPRLASVQLSDVQPDVAQPRGALTGQGSTAAGTDAATSVTLPPLSLRAGQAVRYRDQVLTMAADRVHIAAKDLKVIASTVQPGTQITAASLETRLPDATVGVPLSALTIQGDTTCVFRQTPDGASAVLVTVLQSQAGRAYVQGPLDVGDLVEVPPPVAICPPQTS